MKEKPINAKQPIATNPVDEGSSSQVVSSVHAAKPYESSEDNVSLIGLEDPARSNFAV